ncbi:hypothetical protein DPSP01_006145 [Paraphaeosphaeria sporulosa]
MSSTHCSPMRVTGPARVQSDSEAEQMSPYGAQCPTSPSTSPFLSLPNELLIAIISYLPDRVTLIALAQTCQMLQTLAESQLFKNIYIRDGPSVTRLAQLLEQPPERLLAVENLEATPWAFGWRGIKRMPELAGKMVRLKRLKVESPLVNTGTRDAWWTEECMREYMDLFDRSNRGMKGAWRCLTSFTLHSHGTHHRYYSIKSVLPVFLSPTLKYLHLSCLDISRANETFAALGASCERTPLETLILERCTEPSSSLFELQAILSRPRALRSFTLLLDVIFAQYKEPLNAQSLSRELVKVRQTSHSSLSRAQMPGLLEALQQQSDSLEYLRYTHHPTSRIVPGSPEYFSTDMTSSLSVLRQSSGGLSTFKRLHALDVGYRTNLAELLLDASLAPPNLLTLGLSGIALDYGRGDTWQHLASYVPAISATTNFSHLRLYTTPSCSEGHLQGMSWQFEYNAHRQIWPRSGVALLEIVKRLHGKASVELVGTRHLPGVFTPFLHGERLSSEEVIFDSRKECNEGGDRRFKRQAYVPDGASGWVGPFLALGNAKWTE